MNERSVQECVEVFHLLFLSFLGKRLDKRRYALKGGCNLRFFFASPRYSEDMDIDAVDVPVHSLQDAVHAILNSSPFRQALQVQGIAIEHITEHKQSETTQRWKLGLHMRGSGRPVPTKVEFSRRGFRGKPVLSSVNPVLVQTYGLPPVMTPHYPAEDALLQKIQALAGRSVTQARDIFDLHLLQSKERMRHVLPVLDAVTLDAARQHALDLSFDDFKGQVLAYLQPEDQAGYDSPQVWESMQLTVLAMLEAVK
ncbi:MAG: nucleotidyl transferase AbiEii/AbiGii toxin family protein [bacterium]